MATELPTVEREKLSTGNEKKEPSISERHHEDQTVYPNGTTLALVMLALYLGVFLVALVRFPAFRVYN